MSGELGWNGKYDEGARLLATTNNFSGIKVNMQLPNNFECAANESYFNFYLGFNEKPSANSGRAIECGISYSNKGWQAFINNNGHETASQKLDFEGGEQLPLELSFDGSIIRLFGGKINLQSSFNLKSAAPKMIIALHESHGNLSDRKVWFDRAVITCNELKVGNKWLSFAQSKARFKFDQIDRKLFNIAQTVSSLTVTMKQPQ